MSRLIEIKPIASDSLGTRSMCTLVKHGGINIIIDPSAALGPYRYGLRPHPIELERLRYHKSIISEVARDVDILIITHYHYDHVPRPYEDISWMKGKKLLIKHPDTFINFSQRRRSMMFLSRIKDLGCEIHFADGKSFTFDDLEIHFSNPVQHGNSPKLGYILQVCIKEDRFRFVYTSDVEGVVDNGQLDFIIRWKPNIIMCDGPMTYMLGDRFSEDDLKRSKENIIKIIETCHPATLILDHHLVRDIDWRSKLLDVERLAGKFGTKICTAASFAGMKEEPLEAMRKLLYEGRSIY